MQSCLRDDAVQAKKELVSDNLPRPCLRLCMSVMSGVHFLRPVSG